MVRDSNPGKDSGAGPQPAFHLQGVLLGVVPRTTREKTREREREREKEREREREEEEEEEEQMMKSIAANHRPVALPQLHH